MVTLTRNTPSADRRNVIELRQAEAALAASEARLRRSQELGGAQPYEWDLASNTVLALPGLAGLFGLPADQPLTYEGLMARIHPDDRSRVRAANQQAVRSRKPYEQEFRVVLSDGGERWLLSRGEVVCDENGQPTTLAGIVLDITRRKQAETALAQREGELAASERRFRVLADAMPQIVWSTRPDGYHDYFNQRWYEFTGAPEGSTYGNAWSGLFHPDDQESTWARWHHALVTGEPYEIEYRLRHRSGEYRWVLGRALPVRNEQGEIERWFGTCTDIHELKQAEEAERRLAAIIESSDDAILSMNLASTITSWNRGAERLYGYRTEEVIGRPITILIPEDRQDEEVELFERCRRGEQIEHFETVRRRKDGSTVEISLTVSPVRDEQGRIIGASKIARDISERKRLEEQQALVNRELHHRVKNTLATVQAVISSTARRAQSIAEFQQAVTERITSLARTHTLLIEKDRCGASLRDLLNSELTPYDDGTGHRVRLDGPDVRLPSEIAVAFGMGIHELTTNAAKYGAFSLPGGCVEVTWDLEEQADGCRLTLEWQERGGPPVRQPERQGFGSVLLQRALGRQLGGKVETTYAPDGLQVRISATLPPHGAQW